MGRDCAEDEGGGLGKDRILPVDRDSPPVGRKPYAAIEIGGDELQTAARYPGGPPLFDFTPDRAVQKRGAAVAGTIEVEMTAPKSLF